MSEIEPWRLTHLGDRLASASADQQADLLTEAFRLAFPCPNRDEDMDGYIAWRDLENNFIGKIRAEAFESAARMLVPAGRSFVLHSADSRYPKGPNAIVYSERWSRYDADASTEGLALGAAALRARGMRHG